MLSGVQNGLQTLRQGLTSVSLNSSIFSEGLMSPSWTEMAPITPDQLLLSDILYHPIDVDNPTEQFTST